MNLSQLRSKWLERVVSVGILFFFIPTISCPPAVYAQMGSLPLPTSSLIVPSAAFTPTVIKGLRIDPQNVLQFNFIVDTGDTEIKGDALKNESTKLIKYFLAALTTPDKEMWVNLSPTEKDRIIPDGLGSTEMGRDLLAQDYLLKQLTASLMYPESELGERFWKTVYTQIKEQYGTTELPVNTLNKVWIVPDKALVCEHEDTAFVVEKHLKVMLEEEYFSEQRTVNGEQSENSQSTVHSPLTTQIIKQILIPAIEKEVNEGRNFAQLRQIYNSMILATWYKRRLKESLLGQLYVDQNKTRGIDLKDKDAKYKIYHQYLEAFKKGAFDYIKEDYDPALQEVMTRKYISGGMAYDAAMVAIVSPAELDQAQLASIAAEDGKIWNVGGTYVEYGDKNIKLITDAASLAEDQADEFARQGKEVKKLSGIFRHELGNVVNLMIGWVGIADKKELDKAFDEYERLNDLWKKFIIEKSSYSDVEIGEAFKLYQKELSAWSKKVIPLLDPDDTFTPGIVRSLDFLNRFLPRIFSEDMKYEKVNLQDLVEQSISLLKYYSYSSGGLSSAINNKISVVQDLDETLDEQLFDKLRLMQVLMNLFKNAVEAMPEGGTLTVKTEAVGDGEHFRIIVSDTGKGIPSENLDKIFDMNFTTKKEEGGSGIGSTLNKQYVEAMGGTIEVKSNVNKETIITEKQIGEDWINVSKVLIDHGWAKRINDEEVLLTVDLNKENNEMSEAFGDKYSKTLSILQQAHEGSTFTIELPIRQNPPSSEPSTTETAEEKTDEQISRETPSRTEDEQKIEVTLQLLQSVANQIKKALDDGQTKAWFEGISNELDGISKNRAKKAAYANLAARLAQEIPEKVGFFKSITYQVSNENYRRIGYFFNEGRIEQTDSLYPPLYDLQDKLIKV